MTIIVNMKGGLGNQMFQYACGRALSLRTGNNDLRLNTAGLKRANDVGDIYRPFSLAYFNIKAEIAKESDALAIANPYGHISRLWRYALAKYIYNFYVHFVPGVMHKRGQVYLDGYFQSEQYFKDYEHIIREDFTLKESSRHVDVWREKLSGEKDSVSLHVRRGDYAGHQTLGGICTEAYYARALERISEKVENSRIYVFSDDIAWVKENIPLPENTEYVSSPEMSDYEELVIMSLCRHHIIANSSFSWWGAWLGTYEDTVVIAPNTWVRGRGSEKQNRDTVPASWIRVDSDTH